ncbi:VanW family protein [Bacillus sp. V3B]|uniref:VanW family protein n=1 Tax=Bacillus sp. V3B TaxID=2804915 RepID=UPI0021095542|nr:VanW family protein [Bacillus sp. V3B]
MLIAQQSQVPDDLTLIHEQEPVMTINRSDLSASMPGFGFPLVDTPKLELVANQLDKQIRKEAIDATLDDYGQIVSEQAGVELNRAVFKDHFYTYFYKKGPSNLDVPVRMLYPRVDSELLAQIKTKMIGHYVTYFNVRNKERSHNIFLAAKGINNQVVFPGETFSFNQRVGNRTKEKGYLPAPIIVKGELSEGIGGGICQVSSTLFNAVDRSGLHILQRYSHSKRVPYVPPGRDATVSWWGPDFSFKNEYNQPILIRAKVQSGMMIVLVFSSDDINVNRKQIPSMSNKLPLETEMREAST